MTAIQSNSIWSKSFGILVGDQERIVFSTPLGESELFDTLYIAFPDCFEPESSIRYFPGYEHGTLQLQIALLYLVSGRQLE